MSARNQEGLTPFAHASLNGHFEISVYLLMKHHCKLHVASGHLNSLNFACRGGNVSLVEYLLSLDLTPATGKFGRSALHDAAMYGGYPLVKLLIKRGVSPCITSDDGSNALHAACSNGHKHIAQYLVKVAPELVITKTKNGSTPLHRACEMGHMHVACYFIQELGVNPNAHTVPVLVPVKSKILGSALIHCESALDPSSEVIHGETPRFMSSLTSGYPPYMAASCKADLPNLPVAGVRSSESKYSTNDTFPPRQAKLRLFRCPEATCSLQ